MATSAVTGRVDLTDAQWAALEPLLSRGEERPPERTKRQLINVIRWRGDPEKADQIRRRTAKGRRGGRPVIPGPRRCETNRRL